RVGDGHDRLQAVMIERCNLIGLIFEPRFPVVVCVPAQVAFARNAPAGCRPIYNTDCDETDDHGDDRRQRLITIQRFTYAHVSAPCHCWDAAIISLYISLYQ